MQPLAPELVKRDLLVEVPNLRFKEVFNLRPRIKLFHIHVGSLSFEHFSFLQRNYLQIPFSQKWFLCKNEKCSKDNDSTHSICTEMCHRGTRDKKWNNDFKILWISQMPFSVWSGIGYILATSSTYSVVGTPEELRTLYHSSFVRLPFLSLSDFLKYLFTCIDKKYLVNMCILKRKIFYVQEKLTSRYFLISRSAVAEELPLLKKLMLICFVLLAQRLKAQMPKHQGNWAPANAIGGELWWASNRLLVSTSMWYGMG